MSTCTIHGTVTSQGGTTGKGFTVQKVKNKMGNKTGAYQITFNTPFSEIPTIVATQTGFGGGEIPADVVDIPSLEKDSATVITGDANNQFSDRQFSFIAIGQL